MPFHPRFSYTNEMVSHLMRIEGARRVVDMLPLPPDVDLQLRQDARRRSTHHSTRIEGNPLQETAIPHVVVHPAERQSQPELEVRNYWRALEWIEIKADQGIRVTEKSMRELHAIIFPAGRGRSRALSEYRKQSIGVIDRQTRRYEYMAPDYQDVPALMEDLARWIVSPAAAALPAPIRAAILAYQFVTIHPFLDGNGRTARALATLELWNSGFALRGFLSMEEYYSRNLEAYYGSLQMGLPANYYEGRHDPDLTPWLGYFIAIMAEASDGVCRSAEKFYQSRYEPNAPWENLSRLEQQVLSRCLTLAMEGRDPLAFTPVEVRDWFGVTERTAHEWLRNWAVAGFVRPAVEGQRIRRWMLEEKWQNLVLSVARAED